MAKSIFEILDTLETETSVPHIEPKMQSHKINRNQLPSSDIYGDEDKLLDWFRNNECLHAGLQKAVRSHLIDLRAAFKAVKKDATWSPAYGQANLDACTWDIQKRPAQGKTVTQDQALDILKGIDPETLKALLASKGITL